MVAAAVVLLERKRNHPAGAGAAVVVAAAVPVPAEQVAERLRLHQPAARIPEASRLELSFQVEEEPVDLRLMLDARQPSTPCTRLARPFRRVVELDPHDVLLAQFFHAPLSSLDG